jgi:hypothetical protein
LVVTPPSRVVEWSGAKREDASKPDLGVGKRSRKILLLRIEPFTALRVRAKESPFTRPMDAAEKSRREREKAEILTRFRTFADQSEWKKVRISRELGVSLSTVDRWLRGQDKILLASMLAIRRFLEKWE